MWENWKILLRICERVNVKLLENGKSARNMEISENILEIHERIGEKVFMISESLIQRLTTPTPPTLTS